MKKKIMLLVGTILVVGAGVQGVKYVKAGKSIQKSEELSYMQTINPTITQEEVSDLMKEREKVDKLHEELTKLSIDYGIVVDNEKNPNKEPVKFENLSKEQLDKYTELSNLVWEGEIDFLQKEYEIGLITEEEYNKAKLDFESLKENN